jgi:hypothetical protein
MISYSPINDASTASHAEFRDEAANTINDNNNNNDVRQCSPKPVLRVYLERGLARFRFSVTIIRTLAMHPTRFRALASLFPGSQPVPILFATPQRRKHQPVNRTNWEREIRKVRAPFFSVCIFAPPHTGFSCMPSLFSFHRSVVPTTSQT